MLNLRPILIAAFALFLTGCPDNQPTTRYKPNSPYAGVWVRTNDYCDYDYNVAEVKDYRCNGVGWNTPNSVMSIDESWLIITIGKNGEVNRFALTDGNVDVRDWGLGNVSKEGYYTGYVQTYGKDDGQPPDVIRVYVDRDQLTFFNETYPNRVAYLLVTAESAREFETAYNDCARGGYCKGSHRDNREARQEVRQRNIQMKQKWDQGQYDQCKADGGTLSDCQCIAYGGTGQECSAN